MERKSTKIKRNFREARALGKTFGPVEGTRRNWEDYYKDGRVYRVDITQDGDWFDEEDVTEEYDYE